MKTQFERRRHELAINMKSGIAVIPTAGEAIRNKDAHFPYRFDSYFHYLTGFSEPESVVVVIGGKESRSILFCRAKHEEREIWDGFRHGPEEAKTQFHFDDAFAIDEIDTILPQLIENKNIVNQGARVFFACILMIFSLNSCSKDGGIASFVLFCLSIYLFFPFLKKLKENNDL